MSDRVPPAVAAFIRAVPKAELHVHLEGSISAEVAAVLSARRGVKLPAWFEDGAGSGRRFESFREFIELYLAVSRCLVEAQDVVLVVESVASQLAAQNVRYAEVTFTALTHVLRGVEPQALHEGLAAGRALAAQLGVCLRWVFDIVRPFPEQGEPTLAFALEHRRRDPGSVAGLGLAGPESADLPMGPLVEVFSRARAEGLKSLPHAGEMAGPPSVWSALRELRADRIGHGIRCLEDPALVEHLRERQVPLEVCPTSNVVLGAAPSLKEHPLSELVARGLKVTLATDDPALFGTSLVDEYERCAAALNWGLDDVAAMAAVGLELADVDPELRRGWLEELRQLVVTA